MATAPISSPLPDDAKQTVATVLQASLADFVDLSLTAKQWHWNVVGRNFREAHLHLDELVDLARTYTDEVAERAATLGVSPDGRAETVAKSSGLPTPEEGWHQVDDVNVAVVEILAQLIERMRERIAVTGDPDPVTQDLLIAQTAKLEEAHWMWQAKTA
ncbi:MAG TPA: DNA starvation/stationary phase protection protein [Actinomycetospora sp.]|nr:DNA starvation/stationary phase protection protein [Actinomycetospora sp.]